MSRAVSTETATGLSTLFALPAKGLAKRKPRTPILTLRLSEEERARLEQDAAGTTLSAYARSKLFEGAKPLRRRAPAASVEDRAALTRALAMLGRSTEVAALKAMTKAVSDGRVQVSPDTERALLEACATIDAIRKELIAALGLKPE